MLILDYIFSIKKKNHWAKDFGPFPSLHLILQQSYHGAVGGQRADFAAYQAIPCPMSQYKQQPNDFHPYQLTKNCQFLLENDINCSENRQQPNLFTLFLIDKILSDPLWK